MNKEGQRRIIQGRGVKDGITTTYRGHTITVTPEELKKQCLIADGITTTYRGHTITVTPEELHDVVANFGLDVIWTTKQLFAAADRLFPGRAVTG